MKTIFASVATFPCPCQFNAGGTTVCGGSGVAGAV
jgi:hypothetical protein